MHSITISDAHVQYAVGALIVIGLAAGLLYIRSLLKTHDKAIRGLRKDVRGLIAVGLGKDVSSAAPETPESGSEPKKGISKWKVGVALVVVALIVVIFIPKDDVSDASKHRGKIVVAESVKASVSVADKEDAPAAKNDACGKCKVEKVPNEELTTKKVGKEWKFLGHKCVGVSGAPAGNLSQCDACEVDNCTGDDNTSPPTGPCDHCSKIVQ